MRFALVAGIVAMLCSSALAGDPNDWQASPEAYFMTRGERRDWAMLRTEVERQRFIDAFRARRGSDFSAEVQRRVRIVDERMALGDTRASATLRGKIVILLGAPADLTVRYIPKVTTGSVSHPLTTRKGNIADGPPQPSVIGAGEGWVEYTLRYAPNPSLGIGPDDLIIVTEASAASGKDRLKRRRGTASLDDVLEAAARRSILAR